MMRRAKSTECGPHEKRNSGRTPIVPDEAFRRAAALFRAAGDEHRLRLIERLGHGEVCVTELAEAVGAKMSTLSQQLRLLRSERIVKNRRDGKHIFYSLADEHVRELVGAALEHASESPKHHHRPPRKEKP
jgi:DNA-binding transcriptional ArsR family regulator